MNLLPIIYFIVIFSGLNMSLQTVIQERNLLIEPDRVQHSLNQLALAQYQYYAKQVSDGKAAAFTDEFTTLQTEGFLSVWAKDPDPDDVTKDRYSMELDGDNLLLKYKADNPADAGRIAARLGAVAELDNNTVKVSYSRPIDASLMGIFLPRDGSLGMTGTLTTKDIIVTGTLTVKENATLEKKLTVKKDATLEEKLTVKGDSSLKKKLTVAGASELTNTLTVREPSYLYKGLILQNGDASIYGSAHVTDNATVNGKTTLVNATVEQTLTAKNATVKEKLLAEKDAEIKGDVLNGLDVKGGLDVVTGDLAVAESANIAADLDVFGDLWVEDAVDLDGNVDMTGPVDVENKIYARGGVSGIVFPF